MFKHLKNWILNCPAEDHAVASFAWLGGAYLAASTAAAFPILAPVATGAAALATNMSVLEGIMTASHVISNIFAWGWNKIFKPSAQPSASKADSSKSNTQEKDNKKTLQPQNSQEKPKTETKSAPKIVQNPVTPVPGLPSKQQQNVNKPQVVQIPAEQLLMLMQQIQVLNAQIKQMQREILTLRLENQKFRQLNGLANRRVATRHVPQEKVNLHRNYAKTVA